MSPAIPFTMLRGDMSLTGLRAGSSTVHFAQPAPANSFLRFGALARRGSISVSANGGPSLPAVEAPQCGDFPTVAGACPGVADGVYISYFTPIAPGTTSVTFSAADSPHANQPWAIQDVSIWSSNVISVVVPPTNPPVANPTPTPTPIPSNPPSGNNPPPVNTGPPSIGEDPAPVGGTESEGSSPGDGQGGGDGVETIGQDPDEMAIVEAAASSNLGQTDSFEPDLSGARTTRLGRSALRSF